mgnify:CR=1 FL=1
MVDVLDHIDYAEADIDIEASLHADIDVVTPVAVTEG